jgi:4-carboxymuconolactone decarboxylase
MARIPYPDPKTLAPETQEQLAKLAPLNVFRMLAGSEGLLGPFIRLGNHLWNKAKLTPVLREIAILRVGALSNARYEVFQHQRIARSLGMSEPLIAAIASGPDDPALDELQRLVVRFTDELVRDIRVSDRTFAAARARLSVQELQELTVLVGYYMTVSRFLETFGVELEAETDAEAQAETDAPPG